MFSTKISFKISTKRKWTIYFQMEIQVFFLQMAHQMQLFVRILRSLIICYLTTDDARDTSTLPQTITTERSDVSWVTLVIFKMFLSLTLNTQSPSQSAKINFMRNFNPAFWKLELFIV